MVLTMLLEKVHVLVFVRSNRFNPSKLALDNKAAMLETCVPEVDSTVPELDTPTRVMVDSVMQVVDPPMSAVETTVSILDSVMPAMELPMPVVDTAVSVVNAVMSSEVSSSSLPEKCLEALTLTASSGLQSWAPCFSCRPHSPGKAIDMTFK